MIIAVSRAAPRCAAPSRCGALAREAACREPAWSWRDQDVADEAAVEAAAGGEGRGRCGRRRAARACRTGADRRRRVRRGRRHLPVDWQLPRRCPGRSRPATARDRRAARSWPGSLPWNCWVAQPALLQVLRRRHRRAGPALPDRAVAVGAQRPGDDLQARLRCGGSGATLWPSQLSAGTAVVSWIAARSCSHCAITVSRRSVCSSRTWFDSRARTMPSTPCQAISDMIAITTIATSTSTSVKPARGACAARTSGPRMVERSRICRPFVVEDAGIDAAEVRVRRRPHDQLAGVGAAELLAGEIAVADVGELARQLERRQPVVGAPLRRRHLGEAGGVVGQRAGRLHAGAERHGDDRQRDQHLDQREAAAPRDASPASRRRCSATTNGPMPSVASVSRWSSRRSRIRCSPISGSGPSTIARAPITCADVPASSQRVGSGAVAARPTKRKPLPSACSASGSQRAATPEARASARADSSRRHEPRRLVLELATPPGRAAPAWRPPRDRDDRHHDHQLDQREARRRRCARDRTAPRGRPLPPEGGAAREHPVLRQAAGDPSGLAYCQEPMSAFLPSPPATPSAPKL